MYIYDTLVHASKNNKNILIKITTDMWEYLECEYGEYTIIGNINEICDFDKIYIFCRTIKVTKFMNMRTKNKRHM